MSDPFTLLLQICATCTDVTASRIYTDNSVCTHQGESQSNRRIVTLNCISSPEVISSVNHFSTVEASKQSSLTSSDSKRLYLWLLGWVVVYVGGLAFIFRNGGNGRTGFKLVKGLVQSDIAVSQCLDDEDTSDITADLTNVDNASTSSNPIRQEDADLAVPQPEQPRLTKQSVSEPPFSSKSPQESQDLVESIADIPIFRAEAVPVNNPDTDQELVAVWADERGVFSLKNLSVNLFDSSDTDAPAPSINIINDQHRTSTAPVSVQTSVDSSSPGTLIGTLPATDSKTGNTYSYSLIDDQRGCFVINGNELRIADEALLKVETDTTYTVTVRRTDASGNEVDKAFVVNLTKPV